MDSKDKDIETFIKSFDPQEFDEKFEEQIIIVSNAAVDDWKIVGAINLAKEQHKFIKEVIEESRELVLMKETKNDLLQMMHSEYQNDISFHEQLTKIGLWVGLAIALSTGIFIGEKSWVSKAYNAITKSKQDTTATLDYASKKEIIQGPPVYLLGNPKYKPIKPESIRTRQQVIEFLFKNGISGNFYYNDSSKVFPDNRLPDKINIDLNRYSDIQHPSYFTWDGDRVGLFSDEYINSGALQGKLPGSFVDFTPYPNNLIRIYQNDQSNVYFHFIPSIEVSKKRYAVPDSLPGDQWLRIGVGKEEPFMHYLAVRQTALPIRPRVDRTIRTVGAGFLQDMQNLAECCSHLQPYITTKAAYNDNLSPMHLKTFLEGLQEY